MHAAGTEVSPAQSKGDVMGPTVITKTRLYRIDHLTKIRTLAFAVGATVPVEEYERLTGATAPVEARATAAAKPGAPAESAAPKGNPTIAELKARLDELEIPYEKRAKLGELTELAAEAEAAKAAAEAVAAATAAGDEGSGEGAGDPS